MTEYPGNSLNKAAPPATPSSRPEKLEQITTGPVVVRKAGLGRRFKDAFTGDDGRSVAQHVLWDVVIPAAKDMVYDAGLEVLGRSLGIERGSSRRNSVINYNNVSTLASKINYSKPGIMQDPRERERRTERNVTRGRADLQDIILAERVQADAVIAKLQDLITRYGQATIADVFDLVGMTGEFTDEKFGWVNLDGARPRRISDGYLLDLPRPIQLD